MCEDFGLLLIYKVVIPSIFAFCIFGSQAKSDHWKDMARWKGVQNWREE